MHVHIYVVVAVLLWMQGSKGEAAWPLTRSVPTLHKRPYRWLVCWSGLGGLSPCLDCVVVAWRNVANRAQGLRVCDE